MKKNFISGVIVGGLVFGAVGAFAGQYVATDNYFPVKLNGEQIPLIGYNVEGSTYFKLRDIAEKVGGFTVDFQDNTILLTTKKTSTVISDTKINTTTQSDYTSNPDYISALKELTSEYENKCKEIDEEYSKTINSNKAKRASYEDQISDKEDEITELEKSADIYSNAVTDAGMSKYKSILSKIDRAEERIESYERMIENLDALDDAAAQRQVKQKQSAEQVYNENVSELKSKYSNN